MIPWCRGRWGINGSLHSGAGTTPTDAATATATDAATERAAKAVSATEAAVATVGDARWSGGRRSRGQRHRRQCSGIGGQRHGSNGGGSGGCP